MKRWDRCLKFKMMAFFRQICVVDTNICLVLFEENICKVAILRDFGAQRHVGKEETFVKWLSKA